MMKTFWLLLIGLTALWPQDPAAETPKTPAAALQPFIDRHVLAGAVTLVATKDKILSHEAVGFMDVKAQTPMRPDALFWIASQSKPITATAVLMLVDEGKLALDDLVEKYLPEFRGQMVVAEQDPNHVLLRKPVHPITVRNVLSHTSGLRFSSPMEQPTLDALTLKDAVRSYAMLPLQFEPDSKYQYSNAGINTAARILEVLSGMKYEEFMQKRLFDPLGMKDTTFWPSDEQVARLARSYKPNAAKDGLEETTVGQLTYPLTDRRRQPMPAGGLFSTAVDVARFCQMILNGGELGGRRYVSEAAVKQMTVKQTAEALKDGYGLGWSTNGGNFGHGGAFATNMNIDSGRGLITVYMIQHSGFPGDGGKAQGAFRRAAEKLFGN
ncbi:MAG TPA: serine hydrolase domain-containing protein [Planctomycetota bacterium]|nr:serine hydrolase domain-containing protein [Planctomycetota bacterium]